MRLTVPLPDGQLNFHVEIYYPDDKTRFSKTEVMAGVQEIRVKLPPDVDQNDCLIRVFPVQDSEPVSKGYVFLDDGQLHPYRPEIHQLSTAGASITADEPVESVEESDEPPAEIVEEEDLGPNLDMGEPLSLDSSAEVMPGLSIVTEAGIEPLVDEPAELEDESDE